MKDKILVRAFAGPETGIDCPEARHVGAQVIAKKEGLPRSRREKLFLLLQ
jgi:hypothetical protein